MPVKGEEFNAYYRAWDKAAKAWKTGDVGNHSIRWTKDGTDAAVTNGPTEVSAVNHPGLYTVVMTAAEANGNVCAIGGKSATANVEIIPSDYDFRTNPTAAPTALAVADAVWDESRADHVADGSFGQSLQTKTGAATAISASGITLPAPWNDGRAVGRDIVVNGQTRRLKTHPGAGVYTVDTWEPAPTIPSTPDFLLLGTAPVSGSVASGSISAFETTSVTLPAPHNDGSAVGRDIIVSNQARRLMSFGSGKYAIDRVWAPALSGTPEFYLLGSSPAGADRKFDSTAAVGHMTVNDPRYIGGDVYAIVHKPATKQVYSVSTQTFVTPVEANFNDYVIVLTEYGSSGIYTADLPAGAAIDDGRFTIVYKGRTEDMYLAGVTRFWTNPTVGVETNVVRVAGATVNSSGLSAAETAAAVWGALRSGYNTDGTFGQGVRLMDGAISSAKFLIGTLDYTARGIVERIRMFLDATKPVGSGAVSAPRSGNGDMIVLNPDGTPQVNYPVTSSTVTNLQTVGAAKGPA